VQFQGAKDSHGRETLRTCGGFFTRAPKFHWARSFKSPNLENGQGRKCLRITDRGSHVVDGPDSSDSSYNAAAYLLGFKRGTFGLADVRLDLDQPALTGEITRHTKWRCLQRSQNLN